MAIKLINFRKKYGFWFCMKDCDYPSWGTIKKVAFISWAIILFLHLVLFIYVIYTSGK